MSETELLGLPEIAESQANKHVTHNEALRILEVFAGGRVRSRSVSDAQSLSPDNSDAWIVAREEFEVVGVDTSDDILRIDGDKSDRFSVGDTLEVSGSTDNDGTYTVAGVTYDSDDDETDITVEESIDDDTADGDILHAGGAFNDHEDDVAIWIGGAYLFVPPFEGAGPLWVNDEDREVRWKGTAWGVTGPELSIEDDGTQVLGDVPSINFGTGISVTDDGDGTVTVSVSGGGPFTGLSDTPGSYSGQGRRLVRVKADASGLEFHGLPFPVLKKTGDYTVTAADNGKMIAVTDTSSARTITLPSAATAGDGFTIGVYIEDATNPVTIDADGSELIDDDETMDLVAGGDSVLLGCDGTKWRTIASQITPTGAGTGDVTGPGSSDDNAVARYSGTDGSTIQNSKVRIDDDGNLYGHGQRVDFRTSNFTLAAADAGKNLDCASGSAFTVTVPANASVSLPVGYSVGLVQADGNAVTVSPASGVTIRSKGGLTKTNGRWSAATLYKRATDEWVLIGDLA